MTIKSTTTKKNHLRKKCGRNQKKKKKGKEKIINWERYEESYTKFI